MDRHFVILAAGKGTRMKTRRAKVLHPLGGLPVIAHVLRTARLLGAATTCVVVGHQADEVKAALADYEGLSFVLQEPQLGTGHALLQTAPVLGTRRGTVVLLSGDVPLLKASTLTRLIEHHEQARAAATVLTALVEQPHGYGRVIRRDAVIDRIVEERDATPAERAVTEINTGIYAFDLAPLFESLRSIASGNSQGEYYLPDLVAIYRRRGLPVETMTVESITEVSGINSQRELAELAAAVRRSRNEALMAAGVTMLDPATTYVGVEVEIGPDTVLHPCVFLEGRTRVGSGCEIHAGTRIVDSTVGDATLIRNHCVIQASTIEGGAVLGPFAHLRPESIVGEGAHVGNFVELKKTSLGPGAKANHLAYLGDATVGKGANVGAGTITCNYDGVRKHQTVIEDGAFIGSDSQLVAPVRVGAGAYVAAGSTIVEDVPPGALAIARGRQVNKTNWVKGRDRKKE